MRENGVTYYLTPYPATNTQGIVLNQGRDRDGNPVGPKVGESVKGWRYTTEKGWVRV